MLRCTPPLCGGSQRGALGQTVPHVPQYDVRPSHSSKPLNPTMENNALLARLSSATPSTSRGVRPAGSFRISQISLSVRILNVLSRAVAMASLAGSKNAYMLRESRQPESRSAPVSDVGHGKHESWQG